MRTYFKRFEVMVLEMKDIQEMISNLEGNDENIEMLVKRFKELVKDYQAQRCETIGDIISFQFGFKQEETNRTEKLEKETPEQYFEIFMKKNGFGKSNELMKNELKNAFLKSVKEEGIEKAKNKLETGYKLVKEITGFLDNIIK